MAVCPHKRLILLAAATTLLGCVTDSAHQQTARPHCKDDRVQPLVGGLASVGLAEEALRLSGARVMRWNASGAVVTTAYQYGRLSLDLNEENRVIRISCG